LSEIPKQSFVFVKFQFPTALSLSSFSPSKEMTLTFFLFVDLVLTLINLYGFASMLWDKCKAVNQRWRTSEKSLCAIAWMGGGNPHHSCSPLPLLSFASFLSRLSSLFSLRAAPGVLLGMIVAQHKTRKCKFWARFAPALLLNALFYYAWWGSTRPFPPPPS
jgi:uncharacterized membrane protein YsdA (DUF1294 family)